MFGADTTTARPRRAHVLHLRWSSSASKCCQPRSQYSAKNTHASTLLSLNIVEQAINTLKAALKADISQPAIQIQLNNRDEARRQGIALGAVRQRILLEASE